MAVNLNANPGTNPYGAFTVLPTRLWFLLMGCRTRCVGHLMIGDLNNVTCVKWKNDTLTVLRARLSITLCASLQHFHYSYLVNVAAVLAKIRPAWATGDNKDFVETLIRDVNSPSVVSNVFQMKSILS